MEVRFEIDGKVVHRRLELAADQISSLREPMTEIGGDLRKTFDMNFDTRGALYGGWAPRKPRYRGGQRVDTWPLMEKSGTLRRGFRQDVGPFSVRLFNVVRYFPFHQLGSPRLPQRVLMSLREQDGRMIVGTLQNYCIGVLRRTGLR